MDRDIQSIRWTEVKILLDQVLDLPFYLRSSFIAKNCADDQELREELAAYLDLEETITGFIDKPLIDLLEAPSVEQREGEILSSYRLDALIARGGMGAVYRASRIDGSFEQTVAVKVLRRGWISEDLVRRFQRERQILADLDHPNIARILDGGAAEDGFPYYVMEYVEGLRIDEYSRHQNLSESRRVELLQVVCDTVHAAHQRLVIHCDLKPSNILVTGEGQPKLLDFGIAHLVDSREGTEVEGLGNLALGTPRYASPEQRAGLGITTASDIYSLGALLYELVTEQLPDQHSQAWREGASSQHFGLRGDLGAIVQKACAEDPEDRYTSAAEFSDDLNRHLTGFPVSARSGSTSYKLRRFVGRHPLGVLAAVLGILMTWLFLFTLSQQLQKTTKERDRATSLRDAYLEFIEAVDPSSGEVASEAAEEAIESGLATGLSIDDADRALLLDRLGRICLRFDFLEKALPLLEEALSIRRGLSNPDPELIAYSANNLAVLLIRAGELEQARELIEETQALQIDPEFSGRYSRIEVLSNLAAIYEELGDFKRAEELYRRALSLKQDRFGLESPEFATGLNNLGKFLLSRHRLEEAKPLLEQSLDLRQRIYGAEHLKVEVALTNLAFLLSAQGEHEKAIKTNRHILAIRRKHHSEDSPPVARSLNSLAFSLSGLGSPEALKEAEAHLHQARQILRSERGPDHQETLITERNLAEVLIARGQAAEGERISRPAMEKAELAFPEGHWRISDFKSVLGGTLVKQGRAHEAEQLLLETYPIIVRATGEQSRYSLEAKERVRALELLKAQAALDPPTSRESPPIF